MKHPILLPVLITLCLAGPALAARAGDAAGPDSTSAAGDPAVEAPVPAPPPAIVPLLLDRSDLRMGLTVQFPRLPDAGEIAELRVTPGLVHVVLAPEAWPAGYEALAGLDLLPVESDVIVLLRGYPPSREAAEAWNLLRARVRLVLLVSGAPPSSSVVQDLNSMRGLERVVARLDPPSRAGFERLQRPLSFLHIVE
jgi:hypothetical protein